eukprot:COSAG01_NODE_1550_length_9943_cov_233.259651_15_plen_264_part_00
MMLRRRYLEPVYEDDDFIEKVLRTLGEQYEIVGDGLGKGDKLAKTFGEMRLVVCARRDILPHISGAQIATKATGIGGFYTNKGGIAAKFDYRGTSLCFVGSHLAAHEGIKHCRKRNADAAQIQRGARVGNKEVSFDSQFDHVFWGGGPQLPAGESQLVVRSGTVCERGQGRQHRSSGEAVHGEAGCRREGLAIFGGERRAEARDGAGERVQRLVRRAAVRARHQRARLPAHLQDAARPTLRLLLPACALLHRPGAMEVGPRLR